MSGASLVGLLARVLVVLAGLAAHWALRAPRVGGAPGSRAARLLARAPLVDGHVDTPWLWRAAGRDAAAFAGRGAGAAARAVGCAAGLPPARVDGESLLAGGAGGVVLASYVPCEGLAEASERARREAAETVAYALRLVASHPGVLLLATDAEGVREAHRQRRVGVLLALEGAHTLGGGGAEALGAFHALGVRVLTMTHNCHTTLGASCCDASDAVASDGGGLTAEGEAVVRAANRLGVLLDLSHASDGLAAAVLAASQAPVAWTHACARALAEHPRNVPDELLRTLKANGGIIMVTAVPTFLDDKAVRGEGHGVTIERVADHVQYLCDQVGTRHVGLGSDFDGIAHAPVGLEDASKWPALVEALLARGMLEADVEDIVGGNFLRVLDEAQAVARELAASES